MKRELIVKVLKEAKDLYLIGRRHNYGMCFYLEKVLKKYGYRPFLEYCDISDYIPKYNRKFCNANYRKDSYWWDLYDVESRVKAFDKLINYYSQPTLKERIINKIKQYGRKCIFWKRGTDLNKC